MSNVLKANNIFISEEKTVLFSKKNTSQYKQSGKRVLNINENNEKEKSDYISVAMKKAEKIIEEAKAQKDKIISKAQQESDLIRKKAYNAGYEDGKAIGYKEAKKSYDKKLSDVEALKAEYLKKKENTYNELEKEMVKLSVEIAKKIINKRLEEDDEVFIAIAQNVLKKIKSNKYIQMRVSSEDYDKIVNRKDLLTSNIQGIEEIEIIKDDYLKRGSCIIDTGIGIIDGGVETQIKQIKTAFASIMGNAK